MVVRRTRRAVAAAVAVGLIGLVAVGCSEARTPVAAAVTVATGVRAAVDAGDAGDGVEGGKFAEYQAALPGGDALYDDAAFSKALRDAGV
ncbi:hypothetical protein AB0E66_24600 [Streptomyces sp. NPDC033753]|uniref:hypothetical protein n=1 Tax=Streptomyces sp. NPDC033753 TaxID=3155128 RepID=UPI00340DF695